MNEKETASSLSNLEKMRRNPLSLLKSRSILLRLGTWHDYIPKGDILFTGDSMPMSTVKEGITGLAGHYELYP